MKYITKIGAFALIFAYLFFPQVKFIAREDIVYAQIPLKTPAIWTEQDTLDLIKDKAIEYGVSENTMIALVKCESGNDMASTTIQSRHVKNGVREQSYGLVQINLPSWKGQITYEQAISPLFAIDFLAGHLKSGRGYLWSCYSMI